MYTLSNVEMTLSSRVMKFLILAILAAGIGIGAYFYFNSFSILPAKKSATIIISSLQQTKEIDKFYTGVYYIPALDRCMGILKRDVVNIAKEALNPANHLKMAQRFVSGEKVIQESDFDNIKHVVKGYCFKKYEVSIGYDHLMKLLEDQDLISAACTNNLKAIPDPQILAVNCKSTDIHGKYEAEGACYGWDSNDAERKKVIQQTMANDGILEKVNQRGKESLKNFLSVFCN